MATSSRKRPDEPRAAARPARRGPDSDLVEDRDLYQRLGVPEYGVVDPTREQGLVHRRAEGGYGQPHVLEGDTVLEPSAMPGLRVRVAELLGRGPQIG